MVLDTLISIIISFWTTLTAMSPYLLFGFFVSGVLSVFISPKFVETHLGGKGLWPITKASLFGVPLPLCSCGVIPVTVSLKKHGASKGASVSFLLSTPQTGVDSILVTYSLLGPVIAIVRPVIAFITGLIGGTAVQTFVRETPSVPNNNLSETHQNSGNHKSHESKFLKALKHGFVTLPKDISCPVLMGIVVAALIAAFVPEHFIIEGVETLGTLGTMLVMMAMGIPVYVCASASVPLAAVMIAKGVSPGAALVFLMTGPATNAAGLATIWKIMGSRTAIVYLLTVIICALSSGLLLDLIFPELTVSVQEHFHEMSPSLSDHIFGIALLAVLILGIYFKIRLSRQKNREMPEK